MSSVQIEEVKLVDEHPVEEVKKPEKSIKRVPPEEAAKKWEKRLQEINDASKEFDTDDSKFVEARDKFYALLDSAALKAKKGSIPKDLESTVDSAREVYHDCQANAFRSLRKFNRLLLALYNDRMADNQTTISSLVQELTKLDPKFFD